MRRILPLILAFLPSFIKVRLLRTMGHDVHPNAYIGISYLGITKIVMKPNTYIGHGNVFTHLAELHMDEGSRINRWNRVVSKHTYKGILCLGKRSAISLRHYLDVCNLFTIGDDVIIAGHRSTFFTHSKGIEKVDYTKPIKIGDWCYIGSNVCFTPGAHLGNGVFVGMGAVVVGNHSAENYCLLAGNPATKKQNLDPKAKYFLQGPIEHAHTKGLYQTSVI